MAVKEVTTTEVVHTDQNSIEISTNAKGDYSYTAKVYYENDVEAAQKRLVEIDAWFRATFKKPV